MAGPLPQISECPDGARRCLLLSDTHPVLLTNPTQILVDSRVGVAVDSDVCTCHTKLPEGLQGLSYKGRRYQALSLETLSTAAGGDSGFLGLGFRI